MALLCLHCGFAEAKIRVLVSVAPYMQVVTDIGGDEVEVQLVVPQGADSHNYEPTPRQIQEAAHAKVWFTVGELFENKAIEVLRRQNEQLIVCDLRQGLTLEHAGCHHHQGMADPHIWMSPKMMQHEVRLIGQALQRVLPEKQEEIASRLQAYLERLTLLDQEIHSLMQGASGKTVFVVHPAYGYFCREYGVTQLSLEEEGKEPTIKRLLEIIAQAKTLHIDTLFIQSQYGSKAADYIAKEIGANVVVLQANLPDYFQMMHGIATQFAVAAR